MNQLTGRPLMLAAGGTGGHLFPAEALARELTLRGQRVVLVTDRRGKAFGDALPEVPVYRVRAATDAPGLLTKLRAVVALAAGTLEARRLIRAVNPIAVVGFGGYPSVPALQAARLAGIPIILHEQNAVLGRANRMFAGAARVIAVSFPEVAKVSERDRGRIVRTGNPVRPSFAAAGVRGYAAPEPGGPIRVLVLGGSQGARVLSDVLPLAFGRLDDALRARLQISQQCRPEDLVRVRTEYDVAGLFDAELASFFHDVPERMAAAHLVIARAGASTIAELTALGRPALLVPFPYATDDHQAANAWALGQVGAAWPVVQSTFTPAVAADLLGRLFNEPNQLVRAAAAARAWCESDAAARLADAVLGAVPANGNQHRASEAAE
ncbi:MAG: undecaprenyldiphospho-muramoylpentapeptide beta-N-acetylglucosaminyltransferase [Azospirillum sp.]|nr:undecaprenyldiphospho-muramoylpentapeptide beta-N-acetylglucosaminyltransferase [Azospirillum sp.]